VKTRIIFSTLVIVSSLLATTHCFASSAATTKRDNAVQALANKYPSLADNTQALSLAILSYQHLKQDGLDKKDLLTLIDFQKPSTEKRLWVINMKTDTVLNYTLVAQGRNTGFNYAKHFSNTPGSLESSLGTYLTGKTFYGNDGYSMRLIGLVKGFNNNAYERDVVMHGAWYVSAAFAKKYGHLGRSWGCTALNKKILPVVVNEIKGGTELFAYFPEKQWIDSSKYLKPIATA
jgi:hypothetical protein